MIRVMVVDDSPLVRRIASDILSADPQISVVATAAQAEFALAKLERDKPDVITLDLEMPGMGGLAAIRRIMATAPVPIIVLSAHAQAGAEKTLQALELGAVDFVLKPSASLSGGIDAVALELVEKVKSAAGSVLASPGRPRVPLSPTRATGGPVPEPTIGIVAIGASTGGPVALKTVLSGLPGDLPVGIVVVQHMPPLFTKAFAERLDATCSLRVSEAVDGDPVEPGSVLIAPGDWHMTVAASGDRPRVQLNQTPPANGHRPSVDLLMHSVAAAYGRHALGVIMTGMGKDGARGLAELHQRGGYIIAQDKESSVIFGMNREVISAGDAHEVVPVSHIAQRIEEAVRDRTFQHNA
jgi:two-component system, chemotaxis family, protein-glutamate methylesterase/glutaminase